LRGERHVSWARFHECTPVSGNRLRARRLALGAGARGDDGGDDGSGAQGAGKTVTVYSSMPLQGASSPQTKAIVNGMELALEQAGNKAGEHTIKFVSLDNSTAQAGTGRPRRRRPTR
jgi:branched-chain amino acid transport system substrate-binding protein